MTKLFDLQAPFPPGGDQPEATRKLVEGLQDGLSEQVLLGVTGSGKTYTMAMTIAEMERPAIIFSHNKTLAAQLYGEMKEFFPNNAVEYFVSYYDYYQPEAYVPKSDVFIEKDSSINEQIDRMRHSATRALLERRDVIIVASVSCIYGLGSPEAYEKMILRVKKGEEISRKEIVKSLTEMQYERNDVAFTRGTFRLQGDTLDIYPSHSEERAWQLSFFGDELERIREFDPLTGQKFQDLPGISVFPNSHYVTPKPTVLQMINNVKDDLRDRLKHYESKGRVLEAQRLEQRTNFDIEMMVTTGSCKGIENYSRYLSGRKPGEPPPTLFEYVPPDALLFIDESHVSVSQVGGMYNGDRARKSTLVEHGFRLPSAMDNRPLKFEEFDAMRPQTIYVSATPAPFELERTNGEFVEQLVRPTGLVDPEIEVKPAEYQVDDLLGEVQEVIKNNKRVLVTTLTKKMAEDLTDYMIDNGVKVTYLHSDIDTLERIEIIKELRHGKHDVLVGINLLREGLDIPECGLVAILDADKEGFLRSTTSLIQTVGRAARNVDGRVIMYADKMTKSMKAAIEETDRRRERQLAHNKEHGITPKGIVKKIAEIVEKEEEEDTSPQIPVGENLAKYIEGLRKQMLDAASNLDFEEAAKLRDEINQLEEKELGIS